MAKDNKFFEGLRDAMLEGLDALRAGKPLTTRVGMLGRNITVPKAEAWLYKNPVALKMVMEGIEDAKAGRLSDGPNIEGTRR